jgi:hypothetical protein
VPALPAIDWGAHAPQVLAAKVAQQNTIRADQGMGAFSVLRPGEAQSLGARWSTATRAGLARRSCARWPTRCRPTSTAPRSAMRRSRPRSTAWCAATIRTGSTSAMSVLDRAYRADPIGFKATFGDTTLGRLQTWQAHKDSLRRCRWRNTSSAPTIRRSRPRASISRRRPTRSSSGSSRRRSPTARLVADRWVPFVNQAPPVDPLAANALVAEYDKLFKERYVDTGDEGKAKAQAVERLKTVWGPSGGRGRRADASPAGAVLSAGRRLL